MKKILLVASVVIVLAAGASVYIQQKPRLDARAASASASCLPAGTLALLALPDPGHTAEEWKTTDLYKIWTEPQVQAFLGKPLSKLPTSGKDFSDTLAQIERLHPRNLFVALTALDAQNSHPHLVAGFHFDGPSAEVDKLLTEPKNAFREKFPAGKADLVKHQDHTIETYDAGEGNTLASAYAGQWYVISNDVELLKGTLDRLDGRAPANGDATTLDKDADFQTVSAKLPKEHASLIFVRPRPLFAKMYDLAAASGQAVDPAARAEAEKVKAIAATTTIDKGKLRDTIYTLAPGAKRPAASLALSGLALSSADTVFYLASAFNVPDKIDPAGAAGGASSTPGVPGLDAYLALFKGLEQHGITLEKFRAAFGSEGGLLLDWPTTGSAQPNLLLSLDVRDKAAADKFAEGLASGLADAGQWNAAEADGLTVRALTFSSAPMFAPAFAVTDKQFLFGLNEAGVRAAAARAKTGGANFTASQTYKDAVGSVPKANAGFGYLDTKAFFERAYGALRPMAAFGAMMYPQSGDYVDTRKLPDTETISKHLSPIVYSQSYDDQGALVESVGPVTFFQAGTGLGVVAGAAAFPVLQKQMGAFGLPMGGGAGGEEEPAETPEATPAATP